MSVTPELVKQLREKTGAGMMDCKSALTEAKGSIEAAIEVLRKKGLKDIEKRAGKVAAEGIVGVYVHPGDQVVALVELNRLDEGCSCLNRAFYAGMDDAGEMSAWYLFNAIGLYPFSPGSEDYIVSVPLFNKVEFKLGEKSFTIVKKNTSHKISNITYDHKKVDGYFIPHYELIRGKKLVISTR